jgi:outer membrane protein OmpA-like peptidoglycan-associated protein
MPSYLDFDTTKNFRDELLKRTLDPIYGTEPSPKTFTKTNYSVQSLSDSPNLLQPQVDANRPNDLLTPQKYNIFKPTEYFIKDTIDDIPRRANLSLYPYFTPTLDANLIGIINASNFSTESELFKFAANNIKSNPQGPVLRRIQQNLDETTNANAKMLNTFAGGNSLTLFNIISGRQPLSYGTDKITVNSNVVKKTIDFLGTVDGSQLPFDVIPGDYLTNPMNPVYTRPTDVSATTKVWQDLTGVLGSIVGIQRRPLPTRKPSDLLIENMGESSKYRLFDLLSYSKYAPNYTLTAMSQQSSLLFNIPGLIAQGINNILGEGAPAGSAYIGDDRSNNVKNATTDIFSGRPVRSSYYLSLMYDSVATKLFHKTTPITEGGALAGNLTWISTSSQTGVLDQNYIGSSNSSAIAFRPDSILDVTQQILNTKPKTGDEARSHIGHILDQTSKYFKDGDTLISRGSGVMYMDNSGKDIGVQYARVWTKDRPYFKNSDTMPLYKETTDKPYYSGTTTPYRRTGIRRFDGSVMTNTWNLNMAPMSDGSKGFNNSSNIFKNPKSDGFYAKKYMLSIENLAWKASTLPGFTVNDLPYSERGPNGGRVMWFPPYDMKVSEQNSAKWEPNNFLGRPEPIYTYTNTERSGTLSFKIVVDHPSVLNLLIREHFKSVNEQDVDKYITSFFAGAKDIDFYSLIRTYANLDSDDIKLMQDYLNSSGDPATVSQYKLAVSSPVENNPNGTTTDDSNGTPVTLNIKLNFANDKPGPSGQGITSINSYNNIVDDIIAEQQGAINTFSNALTQIVTTSSKDNDADSTIMFGRKLTSSESGTTISNSVNELTSLFSTLQTSMGNFTNTLDVLKNDLKNGLISKNTTILVGSSTTKIGDPTYNYFLSIRRSNSIYKYIINKLSNGVTPTDKWSFIGLSSNVVSAPGQEVIPIVITYTYKELGYDMDGTLTIKTTNYGTNANLENGQKCNI